MSVQTSTATRTDLVAIARELGPKFAERDPRHDADDTFVSENYAELRAAKAFSAAVPADLGGGGATHAQVCHFVRELAHYSPSTALAFSMHSHLLQLLCWRHRTGAIPAAEPFLRRIAAEELVLVSSGASDFLESSGRLEKSDGGYLYSGRKIFGSGSPSGDFLMTTGLYDDPQSGPTILHFVVDLHHPGVRVLDNWRTLGMRATGSNDIVIENFPVPAGAISTTRPKGKWHRFWEVGFPLAYPIIYSAYVGTAEAARELALANVEKRRDDPLVQSLVGEMDTELLVAQSVLGDMIELANSPSFEPSLANAKRALTWKVVVGRAAVRATDLAFEIIGGRGYFRAAAIERFFRDVQGARFHPFQERKLYQFSGRIALGLEPV